VLGRKGEVSRELLALRDAYIEALDAYRRKEWEKALARFEDCLAIVPCTCRASYPRTHRSVSRHRPICRVEWRLVAGGEVEKLQTPAQSVPVLRLQRVSFTVSLVYG
jgi:hypothetical protein